MDPTISAAGVKGEYDLLRHIPTFALKRPWRYTLAGFNFIILMLELDRINVMMIAWIIVPE